MALHVASGGQDIAQRCPQRSWAQRGMANGAGIVSTERGKANEDMLGMANEDMLGMANEGKVEKAKPGHNIQQHQLGKQTNPGHNLRTPNLDSGDSHG